MSTYQVPHLGEFEWQKSVIDKDLSTPPGSPSKGYRYIVGGSPTDAWSGKANYIAIYNGSGWTFVTPFEGMICWVLDEDKLYQYISSWTEYAGASDGKVKATSGDTSGYLDAKIDDDTIEVSSNKLKIADRIENNMMLAFFKLSIVGGLSKYSLIDGMEDEFEDETGVDTVNSTNESYNSTDDYYSPTYTAGGWDAYTKLIIHFNGNDAQTTYTAETGQTVTFVGNAQLDTAQKEFGSASLLMDGTGDWCTVPDSDDWYFGTGDFTIDFWVRFTTSNNEQCLCEQYGDASNYWYISKRQWNDDAGELFFRGIASGSSTGFFKSEGLSWSDNTWYHIAIVRNGSSCYMFKNGVSLAVTQVSAWSTLVNLSAVLKVGGGECQQDFGGWLDEFRLSKGIARWTTGFTPPTSEYVEAPAVYNNMTLLSNAYTAEATPTKGRLVLFEEDVDAITLNTDLKGYVSRDNGTTWTQVTLTDEGDYDTGKRILSSVATDISSQPSDTDMKWKVTTHNEKQLKLHGTGMQWD